MTINNSAMWLVYIDSEGNHHHQPYDELTQAGTLIDPHTGDDMDLVGWTTSQP